MNNVPNTVNIKKPNRTKFWCITIITTVILATLYYIAFSQTDLSTRSTSQSTTQLFLRFVRNPFFDADVRASVPRYIGLMGETVAIAYAGTLAGSILAIPFGFLAAKNVSKGVAPIGKMILNGIRTFPEILFAIIFVSAVGMGPYAGVLAISVNSVGMLGKLYSEAIEGIDMQVVDALKASGANRLQAMWHGVLPQVIPEFQSFAVYRYEIDVRASTVLGFVGAGGIGTQLILDANQRNWEAIGMMLYIIVITVIVIDYCSSRIRKRIV
ncbi:phosphonate ABC transporter, permease protein PhnE [Serpentinicella sp. ANB-PHB4]|uniref:phosphonate ABC transporter, permease protein PhnE n=1 Tax=Serpentinicella sp. ANB-PHB4 TaxID=3074076 RepID=UPI0028589102|nr:phosphonate ABC transporter, permease protein PhnE [Serpentinicella sp. ANB-PHB4]MDR5659736.1 phosphonate ABC transporter, permease protein PhnE [Serpentinicella sp. ANB-PHB4]